MKKFKLPNRVKLVLLLLVLLVLSMLLQGCGGPRYIIDSSSFQVDTLKITDTIYVVQDPIIMEDVEKIDSLNQENIKLTGEIKELTDSLNNQELTNRVDKLKDNLLVEQEILKDLKKELIKPIKIPCDKTIFVLTSVTNIKPETEPTFKEKTSIALSYFGGIVLIIGVLALIIFIVKKIFIK